MSRLRGRTLVRMVTEMGGPRRPRSPILLYEIVVMTAPAAGEVGGTDYVISYVGIAWSNASTTLSNRDLTAS